MSSPILASGLKRLRVQRHGAVKAEQQVSEVGSRQAKGVDQQLKAEAREDRQEGGSREGNRVMVENANQTLLQYREPQ